ncbi:hypothetical protein MKW92_048809 [Papaver armeniacum]|nr:hypothetical protein MKW92_048809 [Papaver armeniacum]
MEFWGIEVKPEQSYKVPATKLNVLHLSQACLGEVMEEEEEEAEAVYVYVKVNEKKIVIGKLSAEKYPQIPFDLVFDKEVELSHSSEDGSVHFAGYKSCLFPEEAFASQGVDGFPLAIRYKGKTARLAAEAAKKVKAADDSDSDDEGMALYNDANGNRSDEEEPTPTPKGEKRPATAANINATPGNKKARLESLQKSSGAMHQGTPYPKGGKTLASGGKESNNSFQPVSCSFCSKAFGTDYALQAHTMDKHVNGGKTPASGGIEPNSSRPFSCSFCSK